MSNNTQSEILLDAGTNELEVLVFSIGGCECGVNVAKVREVIRSKVGVAQSPHMHPSVIGMFNMRGEVIPLVDLKRHLELTEKRVDDPGADESGRIIITEFNGLRTGFLVDGVEQIYRMSWNEAQPAPDLSGLSRKKGPESICTSVIDMDGRLILMLDFESVADAILMEERLHVSSVENMVGVDRATKRVILAEDSPFMRTTMARVFTASGYAQLETFCDGASAWSAIEGSLTDGSAPIDVIVSDIEMPLMDGLHMTKRIKEHPQLEHIPVLLFSSLISQDNLKKGEQVGADMQISKPELPELVRLVDTLAGGGKGKRKAASRKAA